MYLKNKTNRLTIRVSDELLNWLNEEASFLNIAVSDLVRMILQSYCGGERLENSKRD